MEKDLLVEMGVEEEEECEIDDEDIQECDTHDVESVVIESPAVEELRKHVEQVMLEDEDKTTKGTSQAAAYSVTSVMNPKKNIQSSSGGPESSHSTSNCEETTSENQNNLPSIHERTVSECVSDVYSIRSARTNGLSTASTIAPDVIKKRVQLALNKRERQSERKRVLAKGEASAVTRSRRDNAKTIQESNGVWGWD